MRAVVTRPAHDAERIAVPLSARGVEVLTEPLLAVVPAAAVEVDLTGVQAFLVTSANGARALAATVGSDPDARALPALAVGDQTAQTLEEHGFTDVRSADGDVHALSAMVQRDLNPADGALFHAAGSKVAGDLAGDLKAKGYTVRRKVLYETRAAVAFSAEMREALAAGKVDAVFLFSPRTAETFANLAKKADLTDACKNVTAYCLSQAVADKLKEIPFKAARVADRPRQDSLLAVFDEDYPEGVATMTDGGKDEDRNSPADAAAQTDPAASAATGDGTGGDKDGDKTSGAKAATGPKAAGATGPAASSAAPAATPHPGKTAGRASVPPAGPRPAAETPARKSHAAAIAILVLLAAVVLLAGWGSLPLWADRLPAPLRPYAEALIPAPPAPQQSEAVAELRAMVEGLRTDLAATERAVATLRSRLGDLENRPAAVPSGDGDMAAEVAARLAEVEARLADLAATTGEANLSEEIRALEERIGEIAANRAPASTVLGLSERVAQLEGAVRKAVGRQDKALAFLLSVGQLREAINSGRPFDAQLRAAAAVAPEGVAVSAVTAGFADYAGRGVPTKIALQQRLEALSAQAIRADARPEDGDSWINRTIDRLSQVVTVRRTDGTAVGDSPAAVTSRAEAMLAEGDLGAAVAEIAKLDGPAAAVLAGWLADARARLAAEDGIAELTGEALARVGAQAMGDERAPETAEQPQSGDVTGQEG